MLLAILLAASPAAPLNSEGFRLYQQGRFPEALTRFRAAAEADPNHALSRYNFAATLALLRGQGKVCEYDAYPVTILGHLEAAVRLDPRRRTRMQADTDFDSIRDTLGYQRLLGRSPKKLHDVPALLSAVRWWGPAPGAFGNLYALELAANGTFTWSRKVLEPAFHVEVMKGAWSVKGREVTLRFERPVEGHGEALGTLREDGHLVFGAAGWELTDQKSECDA